MKRFAAFLPLMCGSLFAQDLEPAHAIPDMTLLKDAPRWVEPGVPFESPSMAEVLDEQEIREAIREIPEENGGNSNT